jgi:hypothetical protein
MNQSPHESIEHPVKVKKATLKLMTRSLHGYLLAEVE